MSKAEERANEKYPLMQDGDKEGLEALKYMGMEFDSVYDYNSVRYSQQAYFIEGYQQAEEDLIDKTLDFLKDKLYENGYVGIIDLCDDYIKTMKDEYDRKSS